MCFEISGVSDALQELSAESEVLYFVESGRSNNYQLGKKRQKQEED